MLLAKTLFNFNLSNLELESLNSTLKFHFRKKRRRDSQLHSIEINPKSLDKI